MKDIDEIEKKKEEKKEEKKSKSDLIVKIILIIIIILLLLHNCAMVRKANNNEGKTPTGNVDIFEIKCDQSACDSPITNGETNSNNTNNSSNINNGKNTPVSSNDEGEITVLDKDIVWSSENRLRIFENSIYEYNEIIAPESSNVYQFVVKNTTKYNLKYTIDFVEDNKFNINMKYKLKKNDTYIFDEYVSASELKMTEYSLNSGANDTYYLEWKWISSSNDTSIGSNPSSNYRLSILINAEGM